MKKGLKIFWFVFVFVAALTLTQAPTFAEIIAVDKAFFSGFIGSPSNFIGKVVFWKYVLLVVGVFVAVVVAIVDSVIKKHRKECVTKRTSDSKPAKSKKSEVQPKVTSKTPPNVHSSVQPAPRKTPVNSVQTTIVNTNSSSGKFIRVKPNKK